MQNFFCPAGGLGSSPSSVSLSFEVTQAYAFVSLVSMLAPSSDWFVGASGLSLIENGQWVEELIVPLFAYDAGTDSGGSYTAPNSDTNPQARIGILQELPFVVDEEVSPIGRFIFRRQ